MPRTRRDRQVALTKVKKNPERKTKLIEEIREALESSTYVYVMDLSNQRNVHIKELRDLLKPSRLFFGKSSLMRVALGQTQAAEHRPGLAGLARRLKGERAILCTKRSVKDLSKVLQRFQPEEFARAGSISTATVTLESGTEALSKFPHSMDAYLRKLGLKTTLKDGVLHLLTDFVACEENQPISATQSQILKLLGIKLATFIAQPVAVWHDGEVTSLVQDDEDVDADQMQD